MKEELLLFSIVGPHSDYLHYFLLFKNLVNQSVLDVDSSRIGTNQITNKRFIPGRVLKRIILQDFK